MPVRSKYTCYLGPDTRLPMMYMPDCIKSIIDLAEADASRLKHHADFNVGAVSFTPSENADAAAVGVPGFGMDYEIRSRRQATYIGWVSCRARG